MTSFAAAKISTSNNLQYMEGCISVHGYMYTCMSAVYYLQSVFSTDLQLRIGYSYIASYVTPWLSHVSRPLACSVKFVFQ